MDVKQPETEFAKAAFETLDKSSLVKILERLDPKSVLSLCQTNKSFRRVCDDDSVFARLMQVHYPYFPINEDAKAQYMAIAGDIEVKYWFDPNSRDEIIDAKFLKDVSWGERLEGNSFSILGTRIREGTTIWVLSNRKGISSIPTYEAFDKVEDIPIYETVAERWFSKLNGKDRIAKVAEKVRNGVQIGAFLHRLYRVRLP